MKNIFSKKSTRISVVVATVATIILAVAVAFFAQPQTSGNEYFLELKVEKGVVELSATDGVEARQHALLGNIIASYYSGDDKKEWFRATEKTGVVEGDEKSFNFNTEDGFSFVVEVNGTTVNVVATKEAATSSISFEIKEVALVGGSGNAPITDGPAVMVGGNLSKEEKDAIRQEAASDDNAVDVDESGNTIGIQQPENIWTADKSEKDDVIAKDDKGDYHLSESRPESNPSNPVQEAPAKEQPKEEQKPQAPVQEPVQPAEEEKADEIKQKENSYERVSVMISRGNVVSAFSQNGGTGKLNLIVDSVNGNTYVCHDKAGNTYVATITSNAVSFNGEVYYL